MPYTAADAGKTIAQWEVGSWILENFASVEEVKANIGNIVVPAVVFGGWGFAPEAHYIVHDATGKSIVIEYVGGKLNVHDNPLGVITNSPTFDWHMTNLRNYVNGARQILDGRRRGHPGACKDRQLSRVVFPTQSGGRRFESSRRSPRQRAAALRCPSRGLSSNK